MVGGDRYVPLEARGDQFNPPEELVDEKDLVEFWLAFRRNNGWNLPDPEAEQQKAEELAREAQKSSARFFAIKDGGKIVATGKLEVRTEENGAKHGFLEKLTVANSEKYRGKGLSKKITDARTVAARNEGCTHLDAEVYAGNPIGLVTKLNDGYCINDVEFYDEDNKTKGWFDLTKGIDDEPKYDRKKGPLGDLKEINLTDLVAIKSLIAQGYVGIDARNPVEVNGQDPKQWILIMEQIN